MSNLSLSTIEKMDIRQIIEDDHVKERFIKQFGRGEDAEKWYNTEKFHFLTAITENEALQKCTPLSIYKCWIELASNGMSVAKVAKPLAYLSFYNCNAGTKQNQKWENRMVVDISPYGERLIRKNNGQLRSVDEPTVVYEGDEYEKYYRNGSKFIDWKQSKTRGTKIIACFTRMVMPDGSVSFFDMDYDEIERLRRYSHRKNARGKDDAAIKDYSNALYTSNKGQIDLGFLKAKVLKHAMLTLDRFALPNPEVMRFQDDDVSVVENTDKFDLPNNVVEDIEHEDFSDDQEIEEVHYSEEGGVSCDNNGVVIVGEVKDNKQSKSETF